MHSAATTPLSWTPFLQPAVVLASKSGSLLYFSSVTVTMSGPGISNSAAIGGVPGTVTEMVQFPVRPISAGVVTSAAAPTDEIPQIVAATNIACVCISVLSLKGSFYLPNNLPLSE